MFTHATPIGLIVLILGIPGVRVPAGIWESFDRNADALADVLFYETPDGSFYTELGLKTDFWVYYRDTEGGPPGFWFPGPGKTWETSPRLTVTLDTYLGDRWYGFIKFRWDDGIHPGVGSSYNDPVQTRFDEWFVRFQASEWLTLQAGRFTPIFGNFLNRQHTWEMGLISYPHPYEGVTSVSDFAVAPDAAGFAARRDLPDNKLTWIPLVWAPLYTQGVSAFGSWSNWGYAINLTNASPSSRGNMWNDFKWDYPSWIFRLERKFGPDLTMGLNYNQGPYFRVDRAGFLPPGKGIRDYEQTFYSVDFTWAYRKVQLWGEAFFNSFAVPNVADEAEVFSYYLEGRWDMGRKWWTSLRWNQETYNSITTGPGVKADWDNPLWRVDLGLGYRFARHGQIKFQYSHQEQEADFQNGRHFLVTELTFKL